MRCLSAFPPPLRGKRHRLNLQRVHPRQTADANLIEAHRRAISLADPLFLLKLSQPVLQALADILLVHDADSLSGRAEPGVSRPS
jgi:hypothetical protein